jgi:exodeoxyribonuclease X
MTDEILVIDTETTGLDPEDSQIVEIATVPVTRLAGNVWFVGQVRESLVMPTVPIQVEAMACHHITPEMLEDAPDFVSALQIVGPYTPIVAAHNAEFDRSMIGSNICSDWICTWRCAQHLWPQAPSHKNQVLRYWLDLDDDRFGNSPAHRAGHDVLVTAHILAKMLEWHSPQDLLVLTGEPILLESVRFGKHRGMQWSEVPTDYLQWMRRKGDWDRDVAHTVAHHLELRR